MIKKEFVGYVYKSFVKDKTKFPIGWKDAGWGDKALITYHFGYPIYKKRGNKNDWDEEDWPPVKVKVTVEIYD